MTQTSLLKTPISINETTPLLAASSSTEEPPSQSNGAAIIETPTRGDDEDTPLPKLQILVLCIARVVEPIAYFGIFPFINKMIWETGDMDKEDVGFYSGLIESMFSLTQMCLMILWGRAADRIGRKPVLVFSLSGVAIGTAVFGLSKKIWQMVLLRCCAGVFAGSIVTIRTMITENSTKKTQARAFSFFAVSGNIGIFLGPLIGGGLANPADQYPSIFGNIEFLKTFPYVLPTFVTGCIGGIAAICSMFFLKETLKRKSNNGSTLEPTMSTREVVNSPGVGYVLFIYSLVMLLGLAYTTVSPVFWFTPYESGGYGFTPPQISLFLAGIGISQGLWLLVAFPYLHRRYGTGRILKGCFICWPIIFIFAPICNQFLKRGWNVAFWVVAVITQIGGAGVAMAFTCVQLALNDISPSPSLLGTLNAIALTLTSAIRTVAPGIFTSLFATGARNQILGGYLIWPVLIFLTIIGMATIRLLPEKAYGRISKKEDTEAETDI